MQTRNAHDMDWLQLDQRICVVTGGAKGFGDPLQNSLPWSERGLGRSATLSFLSIARY